MFNVARRHSLGQLFFYHVSSVRFLCGVADGPDVPVCREVNLRRQLDEGEVVVHHPQVKVRVNLDAEMC
jgi:hypothetical protein